MMPDEASKMMIVVGSFVFYALEVLRGTSGMFWNHSEVHTSHQLQKQGSEHLSPKILVYEHEIREITLKSPGKWSHSWIFQRVLPSGIPPIRVQRSPEFILAG